MDTYGFKFHILERQVDLKIFRQNSATARADGKTNLEGDLIYISKYMAAKQKCRFDYNKSKGLDYLSFAQRG